MRVGGPAICEVGPRDGLQTLRRTFSVAERVALIEALAGAGLRRIEAVSFVNPARVPQMAGAEEVLAGLDLPADVHLAGLVMNARGAERAVATRLHEVRFVLVASETFSHRNQNAGIEATLAAFADTAPVVARSGKRVTAVIGAAFGCPYEGEVTPGRVRDIVARAVTAGAEEVLLADTIGVGVPPQVAALAALCAPVLGGRPLGFHFHNTRNTGFANAVAAIAAGASVLDASVGGLGGCPFAPGATGNIATEDLAWMMGRMGLETGFDAAALARVVALLGQTVPDAITGQITRAGAFPPEGAGRTETSRQTARSST